MLPHVKSGLRSIMTQDRLQRLILLYVEQNPVASINVDAVIDKCKTMIEFERRFIRKDKNNPYILVYPVLLN
jgi:hypothetical protein